MVLSTHLWSLYPPWVLHNEAALTNSHAGIVEWEWESTAELLEKRLGTGTLPSTAHAQKEKGIPLTLFS